VNPSHGCINCSECKNLFSRHDYQSGFERWGEGEAVRLINNPANWGATDPQYRLLGFSKGDTQNKAMTEAKAGRLPFEAIPFKGMRDRLGILLRALRVLPEQERIDNLFESSEKRFQSGSLIKCSISVKVGENKYSYKLNDILAADNTSGGKVSEIMRRCARKHLSVAKPGQSFILLGVGKTEIDLYKNVFGGLYGQLTSIKETVYRTDDLSWVHVTHLSKSQRDTQFQRWCEGNTSKPKILWARDELAYRGTHSGG
jgi:hypothetical protein